MISILNKFQCLGANCPNTCCKNWNVGVDEQTYEEYKKVKGLEGIMLRLRVQKKQGYRVIRNAVGYHCPYHKNGLCQHQVDGHMERMPQVCRLYPRRIVEMGEVREVTLELSCYEAARVFISHPGRMEFQESEKEMEAQWKLGNEDPGFLSYLFADREKILDYLWRQEDSNLIQDMRDMYRYVYWEHTYLMRDRLVELQRANRAILEFHAEEKGGAFPPALFYPITIMNDIIYQRLWYTLLPLRNAYLYKGIKAYDRQFGKLGVGQADAYLSKQMEKLLMEKPHLKKKYRSYLSFLLQEMYMEAYEDYYLIGHLLLAYLYVQALMIFDLAEYLQYGDLTQEMEIQILSGMEKGMRHSLGSERQFLEKIRSEFMNSNKNML